MASRSYRTQSHYERTPLRRRASGLGLAIALNLAVMFLLLGLGARPASRAFNQGGPVMINVGPVPEDEPDAQTQQQRAQPPTDAVATKRPPVTPPLILRPNAPVIPPANPDRMIELPSDELAAADISKLGSNAPGGVPGDSEALGKGPNGETLYAAEWVREPTQAELAAYMPKTPVEGYGRAACRTIPGNRVEDCIELENSPANARLARTVRQAAWQFKVRPPRKNGRPMIGEWVVITLYTNGDGAPR